MTTTKTTTAGTRAAVAALFAKYGATLTRGHDPRWHVPVPGGHLAIRVTIRGSVTTSIEVDRWHCRDAPKDIARPWLEANVWPACYRWCVRADGANFMPAGGDYSGTSVLTTEVLEVLKAWLPQEIAWQGESAPWGVRAEDMPDECHDGCSRTDVHGYYYPWKWREGTARYRCARGHTWTCGWGHRESGEAFEMSGKAHGYGAAS